MLGKVCHSMLGISKSNFSTTRLELENIILSNIIILCVFIAFLGFSKFNHGRIRRHHISKHVYSKSFFIEFLGVSSNIFLYISTIMVELEAITLPTYIQVFFHSISRDFKQNISLNLSIHGGIKSNHIVKHLQLSVKRLDILAYGKLFASYEKSLSSKFEGGKSVLKYP